MGKSVPSVRQLEEAAFAFAIALVAILVCAIVDGFDGVVETRAQTYRLLDDPVGFRGTLILRWGWYSLLAAVGTVALGIGALAAKASERASTDQ